LSRRGLGGGLSSGSAAGSQGQGQNDDQNGKPVESMGHSFLLSGRIIKKGPSTKNGEQKIHKGMALADLQFTVLWAGRLSVESGSITASGNSADPPQTQDS